MQGVNKAIIIGTLGQNPDVKYTASGSAVVNVSVATNETWKDKQTGEKQEKTEWHRIVMFGKLAEIAEKYLKTGSQAYFEGKIQTRKWQDNDGKDRYSTEIVANQMQMLGGESHTDNRGDYDKKPETHSNQTGGVVDSAPAGGGFDDIPFTPIRY